MFGYMALCVGGGRIESTFQLFARLIAVMLLQELLLVELKVLSHCLLESCVKKSATIAGYSSKWHEIIMPVRVRHGSRGCSGRRSRHSDRACRHQVRWSLLTIGRIS